MSNLLKAINETPQFFNASVELLCSNMKGLTYNIETITTDGEDVVGVCNDLTLDILNGNKYKIPKGKYKSFEILYLANNGSIDGAVNSMKKIIGGKDYKLPYVRVGVDWFKVIQRKDRYGVYRNELKKWTIQTLRQDHGKDAPFDAPKYDAFTIEPNNTEYQSVVDNCYNLYSEFGHEPSFEPCEFPWIKHLIEHIFSGAKYGYRQGLEYMYWLYMYPKQALPILVLTSVKRNTGKSTFIDFLDIVFGENMVVITPQNISSDFNDTYGLKNVIAIEESRFDSIQTTEKLKAIATQKKMLINPKGIQAYSVPFFGKLIITSNDEHKFSKVDLEEIRYWVLKVPEIKNGHQNTNILESLKEEVPAFLHYLRYEMDAPKVLTRMAFSVESLETEALKNVKSESMTALYKDLYEHFEQIFLDNANLKEIQFTLSDIKTEYFRNDSRIDISYIKKVLVTEFRIPASKLAVRYYKLSQDSGSKQIGKAYTLERSYFDLEPTEESEGGQGLPF